MTTVSVSKEIEFDAGHRVPNHNSKCRNPHGHRYRVVVHCSGTIVTDAGASDEGMLIDFSNLKSLMLKHIHDPLDHGFIVWEGDDDLLECFKWWDPAHIPEPGRTAGMDPGWKIIKFPHIPTAENIAIWCWDTLAPVLHSYFRGNLVLRAVEVYETPTSCAYYEGES